MARKVYVLLALMCAAALLAAQPARLAAQDEPAPRLHIVAPGETLSEIAKQYGVELSRLMLINGIEEADEIVEGQRLHLPAPPTPVPSGVHVVAPGETLSEIAQQHGVGMDELMRLNGITDSDAIVAGQALRLAPPGEAPLTAPEPAPDTAETPQPTETEAAEPTAMPAAGADDGAPDGSSPEASPEESEEAMYTVGPGETLSEIAKELGLTLDQLLAANGIGDPDMVRAGQVLRLPAPSPTPTPEQPATDEPAAEGTGTEETAAEAPAEGEPAEEEASTPAAVDPAKNPIATLNREYTVRYGDSLPSIALRLGLSEEALRHLNGLERGASLVAGETLLLPAGGDDLLVTTPGESYTVQPGDSLGEVAQRFGLTLGDLLHANRISDPDTITVGQELSIPPRPSAGAEPRGAAIGRPRNGYYYYTVRQGDTISELARAFNSTKLALIEYNGLPDESTVYAGLELKIPYGAPSIPQRLPPTPLSGSSFMVSLSRQQCWLFNGDRVRYMWPCSTGYGDWITRTGTFNVQSKIEMARSNAYALDMPYWLGIYDVGAYENGIHGLPIDLRTGKKIWTTLVGEPATFGCAMLGDEDAAALFDLAYIGMPVHIIN